MYWAVLAKNLHSSSSHNAQGVRVMSSRQIGQKLAKKASFFYYYLIFVGLSTKCDFCFIFQNFAGIIIYFFISFFFKRA